MAAHFFVWGGLCDVDSLPGMPALMCERDVIGHRVSMDATAYSKSLLGVSPTCGRAIVCILAEGAIALPVTLSGGALFAS